jgi:hypothetical protein
MEELKISPTKNSYKIIIPLSLLKKKFSNFLASLNYLLLKMFEKKKKNYRAISKFPILNKIIYKTINILSFFIRLFIF